MLAVVNGRVFMPDGKVVRATVLASGRRIDIDPTRDLESLRRIAFTIKDGVVYDWSKDPAGN